MRFQVLGPLRALRGDVELPLGPGKQRAVLGVLLLNANHPVPSGRIVDAVWGDDPPENGANVVQKYVAGLRRVFEPDRSARAPGQVLTLTDAGYLLTVEAGALDLDRFELHVRRAREARAVGDLDNADKEINAGLQLWHGEAYATVAGQVFDNARSRLREARATAFELHADIDLELGRHDELIPELVRLTAEYPLREQLRGALMLSLYRSGRQAEALAAFRETRELLDQEFGVEPGEQLQELHRQILRMDPSLRMTFGASPESSSSSWAAPLGPPVAVEPQAISLLNPTVVVPHPRIAYPPPVVTPKRLWPSTPVARALIVLAALSSGGLATWAIVGFFAARRHSLGGAVAAAAYLVGIVGAGFLLLNSSVIGFLAVVFIMFGGALHVYVTSGPLDTDENPGPMVGGMADRVRRAQAIMIANTQPAIARELGVGRPDLPRWFDDGGVVDVNSAPETALAVVPDVGWQLARQIVVERTYRGPFQSLDDLAERAVIPTRTLRRLEDWLIALP